MPYACTRYVISGQKGLCLVENEGTARMEDQEHDTMPDQSSLSAAQSSTEWIDGLTAHVDSNADRYANGSTYSYFADYEYSSDESSDENCCPDDTGTSEECGFNGHAGEIAEPDTDQLAVAAFPELKENLPKKRRLQSITNVAQRWGISAEDAAELMRNVELANANTEW